MLYDYYMIPFESVQLILKFDIRIWYKLPRDSQMKRIFVVVIWLPWGYKHFRIYRNNVLVNFIYLEYFQSWKPLYLPAVHSHQFVQPLYLIN